MAQKGVIELNFLLAFLLISGISLAVLRHAKMTIEALKTDLVAQVARDEAINESIRSLRVNTDGGFGCNYVVRGSSSYDAHIKNCWLTATYNPYLLTSAEYLLGASPGLGGINIDHYLKDARHCSSRFSIFEVETERKLRSINSSISAYKCNFVGGKIEKDISIYGNGLFTSNVALKNNGKVKEPLKVVTTGFQKYTGTTSMDSSALLLAGGDVEISSISNPSKFNLSLTVVSMTGKVTIDEIIGPVSLRILSFYPPKAPRSKLSDKNSVLPEFLRGVQPLYLGVE